MKRILTLTLFVCLFVSASAFAAIDAAWTASVEEKRPNTLYLNMVRGKHHNMGTTMEISDFTGLNAAAINATAMTPVQFELRREAGTAAFEGTFRNGKGAGQLTFTENRGYARAVRALGVEFELGRGHRKQTEEEWLFTLALHDVSTAYIRTMQAKGFRVSLEKYLNMRIFDVTPEYVDEMRSLGFKDIDNEELVESKIHGVTPKYVREMRARGWNLTLDEYQSSRIHGATPEYAEEIAKLGYAGLDHRDLVSFRIHGVTAEYIRELRELGYDKVPARKLAEMRIHGVTAQYIRDLKAAGYSGVPVQKLISMRIAGLDATYLKKMNQ